RNKISTHPATLPTKIGKCKTRSSNHSETISKPGGVVAAGLEVKAQPRTAFGVGGVVAEGTGHRGAFPVQPVPQKRRAASGRIGAADLRQQRHA
ncbi:MULTISPECIES: hypothetical protein, partial [unclassified Streptomyces]|uniref:hypothetical protein n=1 Tax=unclassified Streptomyces TaxID=2593676 RepID=UPI0035E1CFF5